MEVPSRNQHPQDDDAKTKGEQVLSTHKRVKVASLGPPRKGLSEGLICESDKPPGVGETGEAKQGAEMRADGSTEMSVRGMEKTSRRGIGNVSLGHRRRRNTTDRACRACAQEVMQFCVCYSGRLQRRTYLCAVWTENTASRIFK